MPIDMEKGGNPASHKCAIPIGEDAMKNSVTEELVQAIEKLPEDKKRQVAEFISKLDPQSKASPLKKSSKLTPAQIAEINAFTERMCEKSKQYPEFDVLEVMEAIRR